MGRAHGVASAFYEQWVKLAPQLGDVDLRPLMHLSRDRKLAIAAYDELSQEAQKMLDALLGATSVIPTLVDQIKALGESEAERVLTRLGRKARTDQFTADSVARCLNITRAFPALGPQLALLLGEIPSTRRPIALVPLLQNETWAQVSCSVGKWMPIPRLPSNERSPRKGGNPNGNFRVERRPRRQRFFRPSVAE